MNLFLYQGNNYYNRKIIYATRDLEYMAKGFSRIASIDNVAFIVNDGIATSQVINYDHDELGFGDYVVIYEAGTDAILSRWWVTKNTVTRRGQVMLTLLRDVIADWYNEILTAPAFIRKGAVLSINDPAIFNNETMNFNQIKTSEKFIKDKTKCGWYVGYLSKSVGSQSIQIPRESVTVGYKYDSIEQYPYYNYSATNPFICNYDKVIHNFFCYDSTYHSTQNYCVGFDNTSSPVYPTISGYHQTDYIGVSAVKSLSIPDRGFKMRGDDIDNIKNNRIFEEARKLGKWNEYSCYITGAHTEEESSHFRNTQNNIVIKVGDALKKVTLNYGTTSKTVDANNDSQYAEQMFALASALGFNTNTTEGKVSSITFEAKTIYVTITDVDESAGTYVIPGNRAHTNGVPYDIFAIPAGAITLQTGHNGKTSPSLSQKLVASIITGLVGGDSAQLYDVQYLPYCPLDDIYLYDERIDNSSDKLGNTEDQTNYTIVELAEDSSNWTVVIYSSESNINKNIYSAKVNMPTDVEEFKVSNECDMYRLCSPNYNGQFEFSATKNGGISGWNLSLSFKPYMPYIKVSPIFNKLYGSDFDDARGLICGGDFSVSQTDEAWKSYELQNKNYQVMFDRQIQNMEVNNSVQRTKEVFSAIAGTVQGGVTGGMAGSKAGIGGAVAGAAAGTVLSGIAGIYDIELNDKLRAEAIDYAKDQFGYNLQNIKALPYSLTKVGSQNSNYKIWPFLEYYTCTDVEKNAIKNKLKWNGYTIERIGNISAFLRPEDETFIQAKLIRLEAINAGNNITNVINVELQTGVYFT